MDLKKELTILANLFEGRCSLEEIRGNEHISPAFEAHYQYVEDASKLKDELESDHYQVFFLEVFPYASVYLNEEPQMGGEESSNLFELYREHGFQTGIETDHIASELRFMAYLLEKGDAAALGEFFSQHFLLWFFPFMDALKRLEHNFYSAILNHLVNILVLIKTEVGVQKIDHAYAAPDDELLEQESTGLKTIAEFLLAPSKSGFYLSRHQIQKWGSKLETPTGFGTRSQLFPGLVHAAIDYSKIAPLLEMIAADLASWQKSYEEQAALWGEDALSYWKQGLDYSVQIIGTMQEAV